MNFIKTFISEHFGTIFAVATVGRQDGADRARNGSAPSGGKIILHYTVAYTKIDYMKAQVKNDSEKQRKIIAHIVYTRL